MLIIGTYFMSVSYILYCEWVEEGTSPVRPVCMEFSSQGGVSDGQHDRFHVDGHQFLAVLQRLTCEPWLIFI